MPLKRLVSEQPSTIASAPMTAAQQVQTTESLEEAVRPSTRPSVRPSGSTPMRRTITRYAFEFFQDQIETLRGFSLDEKLRGEKGSMSEMVREALDAYIARRNHAARE